MGGTLYFTEKALAEVRTGHTKTWEPFTVPDEASSCWFTEAARGVRSRTWSSGTGRRSGRLVGLGQAGGAVRPPGDAGPDGPSGRGRGDPPVVGERADDVKPAAVGRVWGR